MRPHTLAEALKKNSVVSCRKLAVKCCTTGISVTHKEFYVRSRRLACVLRSAGLRRGDRVGVAGPNSLLHIEAYASAALAGYVVVPINPTLTHTAVAEITALTHMKAVLSIYSDVVADQFPLQSPQILFRTFSEYEDAMKNSEVEVEVGDDSALEPAGLDDEWAVLYTSGTSSGKQKGVLRTQGGTINGILSHSGPMCLNEGSKGLVAFPLHGVSSFFFAFLYLYIGGSMVVADFFTNLVPTGVVEYKAPSLRPLIESEQITFLTLSPLLLRTVFFETQSSACGVTSLKTILVTGAFSTGEFRVALREWFLAKGQTVEIFDVYGSTEAGVITILPPEKLDRYRFIDGCVGAEPVGVHLCRITDTETGAVIEQPNKVGNIEVNTTMMMSGYLSADGSLPAVMEDGFFRQGDLGYRNDDGMLCLKGRSGDVIVHSSGVLQYPIDVESVVHSCVDVPCEVHAVGLPSNQRAERIAVVVVLTDVAATEEDVASVEKAITASLAQRCHVQVRPSSVRVVLSSDPRLPKTLNGKVRKSELRVAFPEGS